MDLRLTSSLVKGPSSEPSSAATSRQQQACPLPDVVGQLHLDRGVAVGPSSSRGSAAQQLVPTKNCTRVKTALHEEFRPPPLSALRGSGKSPHGQSCVCRQMPFGTPAG